MGFKELKLENQICFPLYVCSKEIIKKYTPFLEEIGLTYTQYLVMLVLWEKNSISSKELGEKLFLDSGTLTPLLKKLETMKLLNRNRDKEDERNLSLNLTSEGLLLEKKAHNIPSKVANCLELNEEDFLKLYEVLSKLMLNMKGK